MKSFTLPKFLTVAAVAALIAASGCVSPTVQYQVMQTATLRIMNFAPNCTSPMDVYWGPASQPVSNKAAMIYDLKYGAASVYTTSIPVSAKGTPYLVVVRPTRDTVSSDIKVPITLMPSGKYSIVITRDPNNPANFISTVLTDDVPPSGADPTKNTFVRFMNLQPNVGSLSVRVNDPFTGVAITSSAQAFDGFTPYVPLKTAQDTSFAFYVTNATNQIVARLSYQTFVAGNYYTLVYAGDLCNTPFDNPADTVNDANDTLRLRTFDDNDNGADQTNPPVATYRYNIINAITPANGALFSSVGYIVNGADFPQFNNYSIPPIPVDQAGGSWAGFSTSDNVWNVYYQSAVIPPPPALLVPVVAFGLDANGNSVGQLLSASMTESGIYDTAIAPNHSVSFIFYDTIGAKPSTSAGTKSLAFSVPDQSYPDSVTMIFVPGVYYNKSAPSASLFYWQAPSGSAPVGLKWNGSSGASTGNIGRTGKPYNRVPLAPGTTEQITITDSLYGTGPNGRIPLPGQTFTAHAGGIYEIISVGDYSNAATLKTLVICVNSSQ